MLKNSSANQTVRLVSGKIQYLDAQGQPIKLEETRTDPTLKFQTDGTVVGKRAGQKEPPASG